MIHPSPAELHLIHLFQVKTGAYIVAIGYLLGSIPFGYLVGKSRGLDIRKHGSGNIGATNVTRVLGRGPGRVVFAGDLLKGLIAVLIGKWIAAHFSVQYGQEFHDTYYAFLPPSIGAITAAISCILGHNFPVWLGFKGGKGMATSAGVLFGMMPLAVVICLALWWVAFKISRYVSLASIAASVALPLVTMLLLVFGLMHGWPYFYFTVAASILAIFRHRSNIVRLMNGTESRFEPKPKNPAA